MLPVEQPAIGSYTPVRLLGEGSATYTYLYRHEQRKRYAAFKIMRTPLVTTEAKEEFLTYAKSLKKLTHRNIVAVQEYGLHPTGISNQPYGYLVMQYIESSPISERFSAGHPTPPDEIRRILFPLADALQSANAAHVVHGNLHPGNILQTEKDVFLTDFALPSFGQEVTRDDTSRAFLYRAPEHLKGTASAASDQYALAVMAYEWLCGRRPYLAETPEALLFQQVHEPIAAPSSFNAQIKPLIEATLLQALNIDPGARFPRTITFFDTYLAALMGRSLPVQVSSSPVLPNGEASGTVLVNDTLAQPVAKVSLVVPRGSKNGAARPVVVALDEQTASAPAVTKLPTSRRKSAALEPKQPVSQNLAEQVQQEIAVEPVCERANQMAFSLVRERGPQKASDSDSDTISGSEVGSVEKSESSVLSSVPGDLQRRVEADLRQGGVLSRALSGYEERPAQIEMATLVARSISSNTPACHRSRDRNREVTFVLIASRAFRQSRDCQYCQQSPARAIIFQRHSLYSEICAPY